MMNTQNNRDGSLSRLIVAVAVAACCLTTGAARAEERVYTLRDGRTVRLTRSEEDVAVRLRPHVDAARSARRLSQIGRGELRDLRMNPHLRMKLLRTGDTSLEEIRRLRQDPDIEQVRPVYHFEGSEEPMISSGTIVMKVRADLTAAEINRLFADYRVTLTRTNDRLPGVYVVQPIDGEDEDEVLRAEAMATDHRIVWANPNLIRPRESRQVVASDEFFTEQWHLNNTGQAGGVADADIDAVEAWTQSEGSDVLFGIFDDAVDVEHEDLRDGYIGVGHDPSLESNDDGYTDPRPKQLFDRHGTAVLGLAVARANTLGVRGVSHLSRFTASRGLNELLTEFDTAEVYTFALQQGVDVHVNSWGFVGGIPNPPAVEEAIDRAFETGRVIDDVAHGMVIVFASGNSDVENIPGFELSTLPSVIGVGASNVLDQRASYSNWGSNIDVLAPSGDDFLATLVTTDVSDDGGYSETGYNEGGISTEGLGAEIDGEGNYTQFFSGTSAACPVAAGVCGLILSKNPMLTATDVKLILTHTADKVNPTLAQYNGVTGRSEFYGYGRINANAAVTAATQSLTNGGRTWPGVPYSVSVANSTISFTQSVGTDEFLVVESDAPFGFVPVDGTCYDADQLGCTSAPITALPSGVTLLDVGCGDDRGEGCSSGSTHNVPFLQPVDVKYFGLYARSSIGRYSHGVSVDSDGNVVDSGPVIDPGDGGGDGGDGGNGGDVPIVVKPAVTITASPLSGMSPLTVSFNGNAVSSIPIDESQTAWDFDISDSVTVNSTSRMTSYTYEVPEGQARTFVARLTMVDTDGNTGSASVAINVDGGGISGGGGSGATDLRILVGVPGTVGSDVSSGVSPFDVELSVDASSFSGTLQSIFWDLGDGTTASSLTVPHTYVNDTTANLVFPVTVSVTTATSASTTITTTASRSITVFPSTGTDNGNDNIVLPGTGAEGSGGAVCGMGVGMMMPFACALWLAQRRTRRHT